MVERAGCSRSERPWRPSSPKAPGAGGPTAPFLSQFSKIKEKSRIKRQCAITVEKRRGNTQHFPHRRLASVPLQATRERRRWRRLGCFHHLPFYLLPFLSSLGWAPSVRKEAQRGVKKGIGSLNPSTSTPGSCKPLPAAAKQRGSENPPSLSRPSMADPRGLSA